MTTLEEHLLKTGQSIASVQKRLFAKLIDMLVVIFLGLVWFGGPGSVLGFLYSITADCLPIKGLKGQSLGKRAMGIRIQPASLKASVIRNAPIGFVTFLMIVPFWGWILALLLGIPLGLIEISLMVRADRRQRLGDVMAETIVVDGKEPIVHTHDPQVI